MVSCAIENERENGLERENGFEQMRGKMKIFLPKTHIKCRFFWTNGHDPLTANGRDRLPRGSSFRILKTQAQNLAHLQHVTSTWILTAIPHSIWHMEEKFITILEPTSQHPRQTILETHKSSCIHERDSLATRNWHATHKILLKSIIHWLLSEGLLMRSDFIPHLSPYTCQYTSSENTIRGTI